MKINQEILELYRAYHNETGYREIAVQLTAIQVLQEALQPVTRLANNTDAHVEAALKALEGSSAFVVSALKELKQELDKLA